MAVGQLYISISDLQMLLRDKATGLPLAAGTITFYSDVDRITKKAVFKQTGSPPNYTYTPLPNPCVLSLAGTFQDALGNDITPYYFPYAGTEIDPGEQELYYVEVRNSGGVLQFTREGVPHVTQTQDSQDGEITNFIPNGQFLTHTNPTSTTNPPTVTLGSYLVQYLAQGGFSFNRSTIGTSTFDNSFVQYTSGVGGLSDYPYYGFRFKCTGFQPTDAIRDIGWSWSGVNTFSSGNPVGTTDLTLFFAAESNDASTYVFDLRLIRYFGTGGTPSAYQDTSIGSVTITPSMGYQTKLLQIPATIGTRGENNDDYIAITLRGPASAWDVTFTDFSLLSGDVSPAYFPIQTAANMLSESVAGWMPIPNPDGSDLYLGLQLTVKGMQFDRSQIGEVITLSHLNGFSGSVSTLSNLLLADGAAYSTTGYSPLGIPYSRLWAKYWDATTLIPQYGTGVNFVTSYIPAVTNALRITTNKAGTQTNTANGGTSPGFTISSLYAGSTAYAYKAFLEQNGTTVIAIGTVQGTVAVPTAGTSGFTVSHLQQTANTYTIFSVTAGALPAAGTYFTFSNTVPTNYYVWFTIDGVGVDPAPTPNGILVPLRSTYTVAQAMGMIAEALSGFKASNVATVAAAGIPAGAFFTFYANAIAYNVWYKVAGVGTAPGGNDIEVDLAGTETAAQVASATQLAINRYQFAVPNYIDTFLRAWNGSGNMVVPTDPETSLRFAQQMLYPTAALGTYQLSEVTQHFHTYDKSSLASVTPLGVASSGTDIQISYAGTLSANYGGVENRPINNTVAYAIRY